MSDKLIYTDQSAKDLRLNVIAGGVDPKALAVLTEKKIYVGKFSFWASIIGASHAFHVVSKNFSLSEVFACTEIDTKKRIILSGVLENIENRPITHADSSYVYSFRAKIFDWEETIITQMEKEVDSLEGDKSIGLAYNFPRNGDDPRVPKTLFMAKIHEGMIEVQTVHSYPNENKFVLTHTSIKEKVDE